MRNRACRTALRTRVKSFNAKLAAGDLEAAKAELKTTLRTVDKARSKGLLHPRAAARLKSRLQQKLNRAAASG